MAQSYLITVSGILEKKLGLRILTLLGIISVVNCNLIIKFVYNYWIILFSFVFAGIGGAFSYPIIKTSFMYFPKKAVLINNISSGISGVFSAIFITLADYIINNKAIGLDKKHNMYPEDITNRIKIYSFIISIIVGVLGFIALILVFPYESNKDISSINYLIETIKDREKLVNDSIEEGNNLTDHIIEDSDNINIIEEIEINDDKPLKQAICSYRFLLFNVMSLGLMCIYKYIIYSFFNFCKQFFKSIWLSIWNITECITNICKIWSFDMLFY